MDFAALAVGAIAGIVVGTAAAWFYFRLGFQAIQKRSAEHESQSAVLSERLAAKERQVVVVVAVIVSANRLVK